MANAVPMIRPASFLCQALYAQLFEWIVSRLNSFMGSGSAGGGAFIGLLDVFGFENFESNSYEQLCINYTNEKLQKHFIDYEVTTTPLQPSLSLPFLSQSLPPGSAAN